MSRTKEDVYDELVSPLVVQLIKLSKEHDIPMLLQFQINDDRPEGEAFFCTTANIPEDGAPSMKRAYRLLKTGYSEPQVLAMTIINGPPKT